MGLDIGYSNSKGGYWIYGFKDWTWTVFLRIRILKKAKLIDIGLCVAFKGYMENFYWTVI